MFPAVIFDLDGTLVQTEELKAQAYIQATRLLVGDLYSDAAIIMLYQQRIGLTRRDMCCFLLENLSDLAQACQRQQDQYRASEPWEVLSLIRNATYEKIIACPRTLQDARYEHNVGLLRDFRAGSAKIALATSSLREEAMPVLEALGLVDQFDAIVTLEQVQQPKPHPEMYLLAAQRLGIDPPDCLAIEDSDMGTRSGVAAGMKVIAVANYLTEASLRTLDILEQQWIVYDPADLAAVVARRLAERNGA